MQVSESYCEGHTDVLDEEIICKDDFHFCIWCGMPVGPCNCFEGFSGSPEEILLLCTYISNLERFFQRKLNPVEKRAIIQLYISFLES